MKIVIVGDGKVGSTLASQLAREDHDIVVIDNNQRVLDASVETTDVLVVQGNGASLKTQLEAGVGSSDLLIAATSADETNLLSCMLARKLGCTHTIARVRNPDYADQIFFLKDELGLSMTVNPERSAAVEIYRLLQFPAFLRRDSFAKGRAEIVEILLEPGSPLDGKQLSELQRITKVRVLVCAVQRGSEAYIPDGHFCLRSGDAIYVTAPRQDLAALIKHLDLYTRKVRNVMIVGGSSIAYYLAADLLAAGVGVKLIESQYERCVQLAEMLPQAVVLHADGSDQSVLLSEGIEQIDAMVTLTNMDEENLLISMYAKHLGVPTVITKINRTEYSEVFRSKGIDCVISPRQLAANDVVRYVRAMQNTSAEAVITLHRLVDDKVEALEFLVEESTLHLGETLIDIPLRPNILIACISRMGKIIIPSGTDTIQLHDTVVVVTTANRVVDELNDIFADAPDYTRRTIGFDEDGHMGEYMK